MLNTLEMQNLKEASLKLPGTSVQEEEEYVTYHPVLILMSAVLSLGRRWYAQALPARRYFEENVYPSLTPKTLEGVRSLMSSSGAKEENWNLAARSLWGNNEWTKAKSLFELTNYLIGWHQKNASGLSEIEALRKWASSVSKEDFVGRIKRLGPRAHEQLLWYLEGKQAVKFDRHVTNFVSEATGRKVNDEEAIQALRQIAGEIGITATALDARIWDYMQSHCSC